MNRPRDDEYDSLRDLMGGDSSDSNEDPADSRRDAVESDELEDLPPGVPPEYADVYRRAYERALRGEEPTDSIEPERPEPVAPAAAAPAAAEPEPGASTAEPSAPAAEPATAAPTVEPSLPARPARDAADQPREAPAPVRPAGEAGYEEPTRQISVGRGADPKPSRAAATPVPAARTAPAARPAREASGPRSKQAPWSSYWGAGDSDEERRKRRLAAIAFVVLALVLVLGAFGLGRLFADNAASSDMDTDTGTGTDTASESDGSGEPQQAAPYKGAVRAVPIADAMATCQAGSSVDAAGNPTTYEPAKALDKNLSTAWRCDGSGAGERFTVTLPEETTVAEVGLVPGYAKTDPASGVDRYAENNRITKVRWRFDDGTTFVQKMNGNPADRSMRTRRLPETATSQVVIEILASQPGARNTVAISEVRIATPAG